MFIYALVGKSGSGKSHRAQYLSRDYGIECIVDDGLLIKGNRVVAGVSAKREETRIAAVKRAIFTNPDHRQQVIDAIGRLKPASILILGTSEEMVNRIAENLSLPGIQKIIKIEDVASPKEIETATRIRREQGKHVIPVPTFAIKKDFSGYFIDSIKNLTRRDKDIEIEDIEKTVVRPTFSYLGRYTISNNVIKSMVAFSGGRVDGVGKVLKVNIDNGSSGIKIDMDISVKFGYKIQEVVESLRNHLKSEIEYITAINILEIDVYVKSLMFEK